MTLPADQARQEAVLCEGQAAILIDHLSPEPDRK
jgi:hypothetical protein